MFITDKEAEHPVMSALIGKGQQVWGYVSLNIAIPWFNLVFELTDEDGHQFHQTVHLTTLNQLLDIKEIGQIIQLDLVSPGHMNKQGRWQMDPLKEIIEGVEPDTEGQKAYVYVLENGERYVRSNMSMLETDLIDVKVIFKTR